MIVVALVGMQPNVESRTYRGCSLKPYNLRNDAHVVTRGEGWEEGGTVRELGIDMYTLLYLRWITNKDLLYSTGNSAQCYVTTYMGK